jgi:phosphatidylserine/phosphatidylglycerophosphate/cardiolipin synthase-like enzyme
MFFMKDEIELPVESKYFDQLELKKLKTGKTNLLKSKTYNTFEEADGHILNPVPQSDRPSDKNEIGELCKVKKYGEDLRDFTFRAVDNTDYSDEANLKFIKFREFWGISMASSLARFPRVAEIPVYKYSQGTKNDCCCVRGFKSLLNQGQLRWLMIGYNNVWYYSDSTCQPDQMNDNMMLDLSCRLRLEKFTTRHIIIVIEMSRRSLKIELPYYQGLYAYNSLVTAFRYSSYSCLHRFKSFAPPREQNDCELFVDGKGYFKDLATRLREAKEEIMICGWMISPEFSLIRPVKKEHSDGTSIRDDKNNLINILKERAYLGVRVYILVYQEFAMQMYNDSLHCKKTLEELNQKNIKVLRHPTNFGQALLWSHHEKMVIIDRSCVMMGGLDIAWGRWDTHEHDLFDFYGGRNFPGVDFYNAFIKDFTKGREYQKGLLPKDKPRMPWHDVAMRLEGPIVFDFLTHFVTYWNNSREINDEKEVLFTQLSITNPRFYISNSIKKILRGKIGEISVLEELFKENSKLPSKPGQIGSTSIAKDKVQVSNDIEPAIVKKDSNWQEVADEEGLKSDSFEYSKHHDGFTDMQLVRFEENLKGENEYAGKYEDKFLKNLDEKFEVQNFMYKIEEGPMVINSATRSIAPNISPPTPIDGTSKAYVPGKGNTGEMISANNVNMDTMHAMHTNPVQISRSYNQNKSSPNIKLDPEEFLKSELGLSSLEEVDKEEIWSPHYPETMNNDKRHYGDDDPVLADIYEVPVEGLVRTTFKEEHFRNAQVYPSSKFGAKGKMKMQALRSSSFWSLGLDEVERSIQNCYIEIITNAKHYIYIENQFFISSTSPDVDTDEVIKNRIAKAIFERVKKAVQENQNFKVIIFIPLLPAFEANLDEKEGSIMQVQIALENKTLGSQERGLIRSISNITDNPDKYIMICGLRKYQFPPKPKAFTIANLQDQSKQNSKQSNELKVEQSKGNDPVSLTPNTLKPVASQKEVNFNNTLRQTTLELKNKDAENINSHFHDELPTHEEDKTKMPVTELIYIHSKVSLCYKAYHN